MDRLPQGRRVEGEAIGAIFEAEIRFVYNCGPLKGGLMLALGCHAC